MKCDKCGYATFKRFGVYCELEGIPICCDDDKKEICPYEKD